MTRHLLYHLYPRRLEAHGVWQRNLEELKVRLPLFNGKRVVAVALDHTTDGLAIVEEQLRGMDVEVRVLKNDPTLREVFTWVPLWAELEKYQGEADVTFYGHAKGVTRPVNPGVAIHHWVRILYECCLDYWPIVEDQLCRWPITGAFKKIGRGFQGSASAWHYSGTFYWVYNKDFYMRPWRTLDQKWWGTESWPGINYQVGEAGCLFHQGVVPSLDLYRLDYVQRVAAEFAAWQAERMHLRTPAELLK